MNSRIRQALALIVALAAFLLGAGQASASVVHPLLGDLDVDRVMAPVALGQDGSRIAFIATTYDSDYLSNAVYVTDADGSNPIRLYDRSDGGLSNLRASGDGQWVTWEGGAGGGLFVARTDGSSQRRVSLRGRYEYGFSIGEDGRLFAAAQAGDRHNPYDALNVARPEDGAFSQVGATSLSLPPNSVTSQALRLSDSGESWGSCLRFAPRKSAVRKQKRGAKSKKQEERKGGYQVALGRLNESTGTLDYVTMPGRRYTPLKREGFAGKTALAYMGSGACATSDDGSTVVTLAGAKRGGPVLLASGERGTHITKLPPNMRSIHSVSPSGRYAIVSASESWSEVSGPSTQILSNQFVVADTATGAIYPVSTKQFGDPTSGGTVGAIAWSPDESRVILAKAGSGLLIVSTAGSTVFVPTPPAPYGAAFDDEELDAIGFSPDGSQVIFGAEDLESDQTSEHPFAVPVTGGPASYLLSGSVRSFGSVTLSEDGTRAWLTPSWACDFAYPVPLFAADLSNLLVTPFTT